MKILKLKIERCGDCPHIAFIIPKGWMCKKLLEKTHPNQIAMLCPLDEHDGIPSNNTD